MTEVIYHCNKCGYKSTITWNNRCPMCNARAVMARCFDCQYRAYHQEFLRNGCPKCASTSILIGGGISSAEKLPSILGLGVFMIVLFVLLIGFSFIDQLRFESRLAVNNLPFPWFVLFSVMVSGTLGLLVKFKFDKNLKIKQKAREIEARDKNMRPPIAGAQKTILNLTEINNRNLPRTVMTPVEMSDAKMIRKKIKETLSELPIIEQQSLSDLRQQMISQLGAIHPSMYKGSLKNTLNFVDRMIQETEGYILSCKGIVKVEKAFVISDWPIRKPVMEIQYEQFWDNKTSNVYSEHVMRIGIDRYEVFGSKKSDDRMKAIWNK